MEFDSFTIAFHVRNPDAPALAAPEADALQDAHLDHLARLHEEGHVLAAGPLGGGPAEELRGLTVLRADLPAATRLLEADPAVAAGRFLLRLLPWRVPAGAARFAPARFPHSMAEVRD
jgi:uncharacterized protein